MTDRSGPNELNKINNYDLKSIFSCYFGDNPDTNPYSNLDNSLDYTDIPLLISKFKNKSDPIFLSLNIQSLPSKFNALKILLNEFETNNINIALIALQEIWNLNHHDLFSIPNYTFLYRQRQNTRGGGIGFYVKKHTSPVINNTLSVFTEKVFECLTIDLTINKRKISVSNIYRSPQNDQDSLTNISEELNTFLSKLHRNDLPYYIFLDSNINLLKIDHCATAQKYIY